MGFSHDMYPQKWMGYNDGYDDFYNNKIAFLDATKFETDKFTLRLWKGNYAIFGGLGAEIGLYNTNGDCMTRKELKDLGLKSTTLLIVNKKDNKIVNQYTEKSPSFWTTMFHAGPIWYTRDTVYTINIFEFETVEQATEFARQLTLVQDKLNNAEGYKYNRNEVIDIKQSGNIVTITWGKPEDQ